MDYSIDRREEHHACVVRVDGDIDLGAVPELRQALDQVIETGCSNVVIDLTGVTYADSSALGLLVWLDHQLQPRSGKAVLAGANRDVERSSSSQACSWLQDVSRRPMISRAPWRASTRSRTRPRSSGDTL